MKAPKIRRRKYDSGKVGWQVDFGTVNGRRVQKSYETKGKAEQAKADEMRLRETLGTRASNVADADMAAILAAHERLVAAGGSLPDAVEFWFKHAPRMKEAVSLELMVERFTDAKKKGKRSRSYLSQLSVSLGALVSSSPGRLAHEVTRPDLEAWVKRKGWAAKTCNNYLGDVSTLFEWGIKQGFAQVNPALEVERFRVESRDVEALTDVESSDLLVAAAGDLLVLPYLVIGLFAGVRPAELCRLSWEDINLDERHLVVSGRHAKTRQRRVVDLSSNAKAWLELVPVGERAGKICKRGFADAWRFMRRELGWNVGNGAKRWPKSNAPVTRGEWAHNALRHTFASMHYAQHQDEDGLQVQMGHESAAMLHKHYRALRTKAEAARFWGLLPPGIVPAVDVSASPAGD